MAPAKIRRVCRGTPLRLDVHFANLLQFMIFSCAANVSGWAGEASFPKRSIRGMYFGGGCVFTYVRAPDSPLKQVQFPGPCHGLGAAVRLELTVDVVDVLLDGAHGDEQSLRYPPVRLAGGDETQHLQLALRQRLAERTGVYSRFNRRRQRGVSVRGHQQFACVTPGDAEGDGAVEQLRHRLTLVDEGANVALGFGERQGPSQLLHRSFRFALRPESQGLEDQDLDHARYPTAILRRPQQPLQETRRPVVAALKDERPRQREVLDLLQVVWLIVHAKSAFSHPTVNRLRVTPRHPQLRPVRRHPRRQPGDANPLQQSLRFPDRLESAGQISPRAPRLRQGDVAVQQDLRDTSRSTQLDALCQAMFSGFQVVPLPKKLAHPYVSQARGWQSLGAPLGREAQSPAVTSGRFVEVPPDHLQQGQVTEGDQGRVNVSRLSVDFFGFGQDSARRLHVTAHPVRDAQIQQG